MKILALVLAGGNGARLHPRTAEHAKSTLPFARGYWRNIGTVDACQAAQRDVLDPLPRSILASPQWPINGDPYRARRRMVPPAALAPVGAPHVRIGAGAAAGVCGDRSRGQT
jgi:ADP-glucose pyrophosphorylase